MYNNQSYFSESGTVWKVLKHKNWAYLAYSTGKIVAVNLAEKRHVVLGQHKTAVHDLVIKGQILISGSSKPGELQYWDIKSMQNIAKMRFSSLSNIYFVCGKVLATVEKSLIQWDYRNLSEKEDLLESDVL